MTIGSTVERISSVMQGNFEFKKEVRSPMKGKVIYIHPQGRYHVVEFELRGGKVRECFKGCE